MRVELGDLPMGTALSGDESAVPERIEQVRLQRVQIRARLAGPDQVCREHFSQLEQRWADIEVGEASGLPLVDDAGSATPHQARATVDEVVFVAPRETPPADCVEQVEAGSAADQPDRVHAGPSSSHRDKANGLDSLCPLGSIGRELRSVTMSEVQRGARAGFRASVPVFLPTLAIGTTFGLLAAPVLGTWAALLMSALVWSGTAQFAALTSIGGGAAVAAGTGLLANVRYLPMGFAIAPSLCTPAWRRAASGALLADASFAIAHRRDGGGFDIAALEGAAPLQYVGWVGGTAAGVAGASLVADPSRFGFDVLFPVFYLALLLPEVRGSTQAILVALTSAAVTAALIPVAPEGVPVLAGAGAALLGLRKST